MNSAGVPVELRVAAILRAMMPLLPMPVTTTRPVQACSRPGARSKVAAMGPEMRSARPRSASASMRTTFSPVWILRCAFIGFRWYQNQNPRGHGGTQRNFIRKLTSETTPLRLLAAKREARAGGAGDDLAAIVENVAVHDSHGATVVYGFGHRFQVSFFEWAQIIYLQLDGREAFVVF